MKKWIGIAALFFFSCSMPEQKVVVDQVAEEQQIHQLMDDWHKAAADADGEAYFAAMDSASIFLGTDASERWPKDTFEVWAKPFFDRGKAWAFTAYDREIYFAEDGQTAWFEELLNTWMGTCRGSGVVSKTTGEWKIKHYNLAILVPNEKVDAYLELLNDSTP